MKHEHGPALALFCRWVGERERGGEEDFDRLCAAHPKLAGDLRELHRVWWSASLLVARHTPRGAVPSEAAEDERGPG